MDLNTIITIVEVLATAGITGFISSIIWRRQNRKIKNAEADIKVSEAEQSSYDNQIKAMEVGEMYLQKVVELTEQMHNNTALTANSNKAIEDNNIRLKRMEVNLTKLNDDMSFLKEDTANIKDFLNGEFKDYMKHKNELKKRR